MVTRQNFTKKAGDTLAFLHRAWTDRTKTVRKDITGAKFVVTLQPVGQPNGTRIAVTANAVDSEARAVFVPAVTVTLLGSYNYDGVVVLADGSEYSRVDGVVTFTARIKAAVG